MNTRFLMTIFSVTIFLFSHVNAEMEIEPQCDPVPKKNLVFGLTFGAGTVLAAAGAVACWVRQPDPAVAGADFDYAFAKMFAPFVTAATLAFGTTATVNFVRHKKRIDSCRRLSLGIQLNEVILAYDF